MTDFRAAHAAASSWQEAADSCLAQLGPVPPALNVGFLYVTDRFAGDLAEIVAFLKEETGVRHWTGTVGVGVCGSGQEYHDEPAMSLLLAGFPEEQFRMIPPLTEDSAPLLRKHGKWVAGHDFHFGIVHGDPRQMQLPALLQSLAEATHGFLVGGLASSRHGYALIADGTAQAMLAGILFSPEVAVATAVSQGCAPFGAIHEITECQRNIAVRIDNRPALEVLREEMGDVLARNLARAAQNIGVALHVRGSDTGDFLVRNLMGVDENNGLVAIGEMLEAGQLLQFCRRDPDSARADLRRTLRELKARAPKARGALYHACVGRGPHLFGPDSGELRMLREELGDLPLAGLYCNGEIAANRLYGYTGVLTLFL